MILGVVFGFGLGNTIAPSTTRMTLATPPERSGAGSAVQNTVRQIGAVFGVAILSSVVSTVYRNNMTPLISDKGLPPDALAAATDSIGGTTEVASALAKTGVPQSSIDQLLQAANQSFLPALHTAAFVSAGLLVIAIAVILLRLPAKAEAVAWAGSGPGSAPTGDQSAENRVHTVDEMTGELSHVEDSPLGHPAVDAVPAEHAGKHAVAEYPEVATVTLQPTSGGRHAAPSDEGDAAGAADPAGRS